MPATLELACFHPDAAALAQQWGVSRIEYCANALAGGTSPEAREVDRVRREFRGVLGVMLRPRGGIFECSDAEFAQMRDEIPRLAAQGVDFAVWGALTPKAHSTLEWAIWRRWRRCTSSRGCCTGRLIPRAIRLKRFTRPNPWVAAAF